MNTHKARAKQQLQRQNYHTRLPPQYFKLQHIPSDTQTTICGLLVGVKLGCNEERVSVGMEVSPVCTKPLGGEETARKAGNLCSQREVPVQLLPARLTFCTRCQPVCPCKHTHYAMKTDFCLHTVEHMYARWRENHRQRKPFTGTAVRTVTGSHKASPLVGDHMPN